MSAGQASRARSLLLECRFLSLRVKDAELPVLGVRSRSPGHRDAVGSHTSYGTWVRSVQVRRSAHKSQQEGMCCRKTCGSLGGRPVFQWQGRGSGPKARCKSTPRQLAPAVPSTSPVHTSSQWQEEAAAPTKQRLGERGLRDETGGVRS